MLNYVLSGNTSPYVIPSTNTPQVVGSNTGELYITPITVTFDYSSLNPSNIGSIQLGSGSLSLPSLLPGGNLPYINFGASNVNENLVIEIVAIPTTTNITPYAENNIVQLGQITQNGITVDDVIIQLG
jgi:hypothetical protein